MLIASFPDSGAGPSDRLPKRDKILFDKVVLGIINSKKIVVVAGAGMSCSSGIPVSTRDVEGVDEVDEMGCEVVLRGIQADLMIRSGDDSIWVDLSGGSFVFGGIGFPVRKRSLLASRPDDFHTRFEREKTSSHQPPPFPPLIRPRSTSGL